MYYKYKLLGFKNLSKQIILCFLAKSKIKEPLEPTSDSNFRLLAVSILTDASQLKFKNWNKVYFWTSRVPCRV